MPRLKERFFISTPLSFVRTICLTVRQTVKQEYYAQYVISYTKKSLHAETFALSKFFKRADSV